LLAREGKREYVCIKEPAFAGFFIAEINGFTVGDVNQWHFNVDNVCVVKYRTLGGVNRFG